MKKIFEIIRLPNLIIVGLSEYLMFYCLLVPLYDRSSVNPSLNPLEFFLLVFATILVTTGGYLINDILDIETDKINKPERVWVDSLISKNQALMAYFVINLVGIIISIFTAISVGNLSLFLLYPLAAGGLFIYSAFLKRLPLIGNLCVSTFCGLVFILVLFAERKAFAAARKIEPDLAINVYQVFIGFGFFAFLITMMRELVKDLEDIDGDRRANLKTLPITHGVLKAETTIRLFFYVTTILGLTLIYWNYKIVQWMPWGAIYGLVFILLPLYGFMLLLNSNEADKPYRKMSLILKFLMLGGLLYLPMFKWFIA